jgi:hypothetical protein
MGVFHVGDQGSAIWLKMRLGCVTASRMNDVCDMTKKGDEGAKRRKYKLDTVVERISDTLTEVYVTSYMQHGIDTEPIARARYEAVTGNLVQQVGFCTHDSIDFFGCSVDGLLPDGAGIIEIKCCTPANHLEIILADVVPPQYMKQMATCCLITGRTYCDFIAYSDILPAPSDIFIRRYTPTPEELAEVETQAMKFLAEVDEIFDRITQSEF